MKPILSLVASFFILCPFTIARKVNEERIDSLLADLSHAVDDSSRYYLYKEILYTYSYFRSEEGLKYE